MGLRNMRVGLGICVGLGNVCGVGVYIWDWSIYMGMGIYLWVWGNTCGWSICGCGWVYFRSVRVRVWVLILRFSVLVWLGGMIGRFGGLE